MKKRKMADGGTVGLPQVPNTVGIGENTGVKIPGANLDAGVVATSEKPDVATTIPIPAATGNPNVAGQPVLNKRTLPISARKKPFVRPGEVSINFAGGGSVSSASKRADGCAQRGKTKGRMI